MVLLPPAVQNRIWVLLIAAAVDLLIGDPPRLWHPVRGIGSLVSLSEKLLRKLFAVPPQEHRNDLSKAEAAEMLTDPGNHPQDGMSADGEKKALPQDRFFPLRERIAGLLMVLMVLAVSTGTVVFLMRICGRVHPALRIAAEGVLCGRLLALRSLAEAGFSVRDPLLLGNTEEARKAVSMIVGRDTQQLDAEGIARAAVETVAENTTDGVTAPLLYMFLAGGAGGIFYKAVNTMDSMTGYKNDRYRYFGTAAARLDDVLNWLPSRLTAFFMILACFLPSRGFPGEPSCKVLLPDGAAAFRIWKRDRKKSPSPNSAQTESVCAGALHLRLLGDTWYFGELHHKEEIGDGGRRTVPEDITRAVNLMERTAVLMFSAGIMAMLLVGIVL